MRDLSMVDAAIRYIVAHLSQHMDLEEVARGVHYSKYHLHRVFGETVGMSIHDYAQRRQLTEGAKLLVFSRRSILDIAVRTGYSSPQAFSNAFRQLYKQSPTEFRESEAYYPLQLEFHFAGQAVPLSKENGGIQEITFASDSDLSAWMELVQLAIDGFPHLVESEHRQTVGQAIQEQRALVMRQKQILVGAMILCHETGSIDFLAVHPLFRRRGVAKALLERALTQLLLHRAISTTTFRQGDRADTGHRNALQALGFAEGELVTEFGYPTQRMVLPNPEATKNE